MDDVINISIDTTLSGDGQQLLARIEQAALFEIRRAMSFVLPVALDVQMEPFARNKTDADGAFYVGAVSNRRAQGFSGKAGYAVRPGKNKTFRVFLEYAAGGDTSLTAVDTSGTELPEDIVSRAKKAQVYATEVFNTAFDMSLKQLYSIAPKGLQSRERNVARVLAAIRDIGKTADVAKSYADGKTNKVQKGTRILMSSPAFCMMARLAALISSTIWKPMKFMSDEQAVNFMRDTLQMQHTDRISEPLKYLRSMKFGELLKIIQLGQ